MSMVDPATGKYTIMTVDIKATFHVSDDLYLWEKQTSKFGGLFQKDNQYLEKRPHTITLEEAQLLMSWFDMIALKHFKEQITEILSQTSMPSETKLFLE